MKNKKGLCFITMGTMMLLASLFLVFLNFRQDRESSENAREILIELKDVIPDTTAVQTTEFIESATYNDIFQEYQEYEESTTVPEEKTIRIDDNYYIGTILIPSLDVELPIISEWSYPNLKLSPCRYKGSIAEGNLIIASHNYRSHFGRIQELNSGDIIVITDADGISHNYEVVQSEIIDGYNIESMEFGSDDSWDLTLFTCTLSGQSRVTVRAIEIK
ncbi:MAG: sortase [Ruminococcus sp.]|nr:sortase [Ruminococcus sp.]